MKQTNKLIRFKAILIKIKLIIFLILSISVVILSTYSCILKNELKELGETKQIIIDNRTQLLDYFYKFKNNQDTLIDPDLKEKIQKIIDNPDIKMEDIFLDIKNNL